MKKYLVIALALVMMLALAAPALAADGFTLVRQAKGNLYDLYLNGELLEAGVIGQNNMPGNGKQFTVTYNGVELAFISGNSVSSTTFASYCATIGHDYYWMSSPATCTEPETHWLICKRDCGFDAGYVNTVGDALGHEFINDTGVVVKPRTCTEDGENEAACSRAGCDAIGSRILPALGHDYYWINDIPAATCTESSTHTLICTRDDCDFDAGYVNFFPALGHDYYWMSSPATCTEPETHWLICKRDCGFNAGYVNTVGAALGHAPSDGVCHKCGVNIPTENAQ